MRRLIYTAVFGKYDRVFPPLHPEHCVDYVIITDDPSLKVRGWQTICIDKTPFATDKAANLYHRALVHRLLPDYDASLYVDGNIRLLGSTRPLFESLISSGDHIAMYKHPVRSTVKEEVEAVVKRNKVSDPAAIRQEFLDYKLEGFQDSITLTETTVMLKNHRTEGLFEAMELWWSLFNRYLGRDQISFPYVVWKTGIRIKHLSGSFRDKNPYFAIYPHVGAAGVNPAYVYINARSYDSIGYRVLLKVWHHYWQLKRKIRAKLGEADR